MIFAWLWGVREWLFGPAQPEESGDKASFYPAVEVVDKDGIA